MKQIKIQREDRNELLDKVALSFKDIPVGEKVEVVIRNATKTSAQNRAMHKYFEWIANTLNDNNLYLTKDLIQASYEAEWSKEMVKELIWKPVQKRLTGKKSTTKINTAEVNKIVETIQRALARIGLDVEFPSWEAMLREIIQ